MVLPLVNNALFVVGQVVLYESHYVGRLALRAKVIIKMAGHQASEVRVIEILEKGEDNTTLDGDLLVVPNIELLFFSDL